VGTIEASVRTRLLRVGARLIRWWSTLWCVVERYLERIRMLTATMMQP
jgi:hypothetical protein